MGGPKARYKVAGLGISIMSVTGLFSGIGGFEAAFSDAGFSSRLLVEIDPAASAVLRARFPECDIQPDVLLLKRLPRGTSIITAGFPCQNLSMAGDKTGIGGRKSGIVMKMFELIDRSRVPLVVIENVYFMLQLDAGKAMQFLVERFEALGYHWAYRVLDTMGFGLPQRRRRVYMIASRDLDPRRVLFADETTPLPKEDAQLDKPLGFYWTEGRSGVGFAVDGIPPLKVGSSLGISSQPAVLFPDGEVLKPGVEASERLQGFRRGWTRASADDHRARWRMVGNAVSVPVARWVAKRIRKPGDVLEFKLTSLTDGQKWPDAAWNIGDGRVAVAASDKPVSMPRPSIEEFRDAAWSRLSDRALDGFIRRALEGGLRMPRGFLTALRNAKRLAA